jgi:hypothetical protein
VAVRRLRAGGGLATDPTALDQPESLRVASNVLLDRPGLIRSRPGIGDATGIAARSTQFLPVALAPYNSDAVVQSVSGSSWRLERLSTTATYAGDAVPPEPTLRARSSFAVGRGTLWYTAASGVRALEALGAAGSRVAGIGTDYVVPIAISRRAPTGRFVLPPDGAAAYRVCWVHRSPSGYDQRSAPSSRRLVVNPSPSDRATVAWQVIFLPPGIVQGDRFEVYRTISVASSAVDPGDEMFLAVEYTVTAGDVSAGRIGTLPLSAHPRVVDDTPDDQMGRALYTNASQQGILASNEIPPRAVHLAAWSRRMWYGAVNERPVAIVEPRSAFSASHPETWRDGLHYSTKTANTSNGSVLVTSLSSVAGLRLGQYVSASVRPTVALAPVPALATIAALSTRIAVDNNATITTTPGSEDQIEFTGLPDLAGSGSSPWRTLKAGSSFAVGATAADTADNIAATINATTPLTATSLGDAVFVTDPLGHGVEVTITQTTSATWSRSYTLDLSDQATSTTTGTTLAFHDFLVVNGTEFFVSDTTVTAQGFLLNPSLFGDINWRVIRLPGRTGTLADHVREVSTEIAFALAQYSYVGSIALGADAVADDMTGGWSPVYRASSAAGPYAIAWLSRSPTAPVSFTCPVRPEALVVDRSSADVVLRSARVYWSKPDEPAAVPPINFVDVGDARRAILALVPLDDALLVFKEDGIFSILGSEPWVVDEVSTSHRLLSADAVCVLDGVAYAWTDRGVVAVTAGGVQAEVSAPIASELRALVPEFPLGSTAVTRGAWMTAHPRLGLVILAVPSSAGQPLSATWYVWHTGTQRWSRWERTDRYAVYDPAYGSLLVGIGSSSWLVQRERVASSTQVDAIVTGISGTVVSGIGGAVGLSASLGAFGGREPVAGDVVRVSLASALRFERVLSVGLAGSDRALFIDGAADSGTFDWYQSIPCAIEYQAQHLPGFGTRWEEMHVGLGSSASVWATPWTIGVGGRVGETGALAMVSREVTSGGTSQVVRIGPSRDMVRAYHCYPRLDVRAAGVSWELLELALHASPQSRRVRR